MIDKRVEELKILEDLLQKKRGAFQKFHKKYYRLVFTCIRKVFHKWNIPSNEEDISDIMGQVFLNLVKNDFRKLRLFDPEKGYKLSSWVGLISTNTTYDILRKKRLKAESLDDPDKYVPEPRSVFLSPPEELEKKEKLNIVLKAFEQLSDIDRRFVELYYEHQLTHEEIAMHMGIALNTVYSKKNKIKAKLINIIKNLTDEFPME
jgi:RNA polymerase sigma-70 factor, ECF subfamily